MNTIYQNCTPRKSVFEKFDKDDVLDLSHLLEQKIDPNTFFETNHVTEGMQILFDTAAERFRGEGNMGIVKLTQAMGGGKTHSMIALGLLAQSQEARKIVSIVDMGDQEIKVIGFSGRESDTNLGIWGELASQLGKKELFEDYYSPLQAPGQSAWINLLKGQPVLILLDELPPYLANAQAKAIGNSDLSVVTTAALANLFNAINSEELSQVCLVISDLSASWESGSEILQKSFSDLENELGRFSIELEPVSSVKDEVFDILKTRLFEKIPGSEEVNAVAHEYKAAVEKARSISLTNDSPERRFSQIQDSYPFHPAIKELYERFKENQGFQQTRGLIRLMRTIVADLWENHSDENNYLINAYDIDLNQSAIRNQILQINQNLTNAISHDIANDGNAIVEVKDKEQQTTLHQDAAKLLLISSLSTVDGSVIGLTISDLVSYLASPDRDVTKIREVIENVTTSAWYLHIDKDGRFYFKNIRNLIAEINSLVDSYNNDSARKELRTFLTDKFKPSMMDCYQKVQAFPAIDEIVLDVDQVALLLFEPHVNGGGLHPELESFWKDTQYKNRVMFLSGDRNTMNTLLKTAKEHKAIQHVLARLKEERVAEDSPQYEMALEKSHKVNLSLLQAARETFVSLYYPFALGEEEELRKVDFTMEFSNNEFDGEEQIRSVLAQKRKFDEKPEDTIFRQKIEDRLFTQRQMPWTQIKQRAASNPGWSWHHPRALDHLKDKLIQQDIWRDVNGYIDKNPDRDERTTVEVQVKMRDKDGTAHLRIIPRYGDTVHFEYASEPTPGSQKVEDLDNFPTSAIDVRFLCIDSDGVYETGDVVEWKNEIDLKWNTYDENSQKMVELKASPKAEIKYTTDGSDPLDHGGVYDGPFPVPSGTKYVQAIAQKDGVYSNKLQFEIKDTGVEPDVNRPLEFMREVRTSDTASSFEKLEQLEKHSPVLQALKIDFIVKNGGRNNWLTFQEQGLDLTPQQALELIRSVRESLHFKDNLQITIEAKGLKFERGQDFLSWAADQKLDLSEVKPEEVVQ